MIKRFIVDSTCNNMRFDRWFRNKLGKIPQGLIEKTLRTGKIKINKKKVKSSFKVKTNDKIEIFNFNFEEKINQKNTKFAPTNEIVKELEFFSGVQLNKGVSIQLSTQHLAVLLN